MYKAELTEQGMEVFLALLGTGSQACGFILLDVRHRFEEGEALLDACGVYVHGSHCGWVGARRVTARRTARRASLRAARRAALLRATLRTAARSSRDRGERGGVHTVDSRRWLRHHVHHDRVIGRNDWSPEAAPRRLVDVEQVGLDVVHHGIHAILEKRRDECLRRVAMLLCSLVLRLLQLLQDIKVAFQSCNLLFFVLFGRGYSAKTSRDHDILHNGADLPALHGARPANSQQAHDSAHY